MVVLAWLSFTSKFISNFPSPLFTFLWCLAYSMKNTSLTFFSWNVCGLGNRKSVLHSVLANRSEPHRYLSPWNKTACNIFTTKGSFVPFTLDYFDFRPADGSAGGILFALASMHFSNSSATHGTYTLTTTTTSLTTPTPPQPANVYSPTDHSQKQVFSCQTNHPKTW